MAQRAGKPRGYAKTGGRQKGSLNKNTIYFKDLLENNKEHLVERAISLAMAGNTAIMCKLLDKILPSLNHNENIEAHKTVVDYIREKREEESLKLV